MPAKATPPCRRRLTVVVQREAPTLRPGVVRFVPCQPAVPMPSPRWLDSCVAAWAWHKGGRMYGYGHGFSYGVGLVDGSLPGLPKVLMSVACASFLCAQMMGRREGGFGLPAALVCASI